MDDASWIQLKDGKRPETILEDDYSKSLDADDFPAEIHVAPL